MPFGLFKAIAVPPVKACPISELSLPTKKLEWTVRCKNVTISVAGSALIGKDLGTKWARKSPERLFKMAAGISSHSLEPATPFGSPPASIPQSPQASALAFRRLASKMDAMIVNSIAPFTYEAAPSRVVFGLGSLGKAPEEIERLGAKRVLILTTPGRKKLGEELAARLGAKAAGVFGAAAMHVPVATAEAGRTEAARLNADCYIAIGGGSATGLAKAIAVSTGNPILAIPTTYSGSEMTPTWGLTENGIKKTMRDARARPKTAIYDPALTATMPASLSATSGMNAIAHCVEALYSQEASPIVSLIAEEGIRALAKSLPVVVKEPSNIEARALAFYGAWLNR